MTWPLVVCTHWALLIVGGLGLLFVGGVCLSGLLRFVSYTIWAGLLRARTRQQRAADVRAQAAAATEDAHE